MSMVRPVAVTVAPNGSYKTKADHPSVPLTLPELVECAVCLLYTSDAADE